MPRRRRVYVIRLEDLINDPPPPSKLKPVLRAAEYAAAIMVIGFLLVQVVAYLIPERSMETILIALSGYGLVVSLFIACAKRINHVE